MKLSTPRKIVILVLGLQFLVNIELFAGGPWVQPKRTGYLQGSFSFIPSYTTLYSKDRQNIRLNRTVSDMTFNGYGEYGLTDRITLNGEVPFKFVSTDEELLNGDFETTLEPGSLTGFGNISVALKHLLMKKKLVLAGQARIEANTSKNQPNTGLRTGVSAWGFIPSLSLGGSYNNIFAFMDFGIRFRTNNYSTDYLLASEVGMTLLNSYIIIVALDVRESINEGTSGESGIQTGLYPDNQEYLAYGLKFIWNINHRVGLNFASFGAASGNLVAKSPSYTLGSFIRF